MKPLYCHHAVYADRFSSLHWDKTLIFHIIYLIFALSFKNNILENAYKAFFLFESIAEFHFLKEPKQKNFWYRKQSMS